MHEMSLVRSLLAQVASIVAENDASSANEIVVEISPLSGVEPELVKSAFEQRMIVSDLGTPRLVINEVPLVVACRDCQQETELADFVFRCRECGSGSVRIIRGDEFRLISVALNENAANV